MKLKVPNSPQPIPESADMIFKGKLFEIWQWEQRMYDGSTQIFEKAKRHPSVGVLPVTEKGKIVVTIQEQPLTDPFISLLGGIVGDKEDPLETAKRELMEEAGLSAKHMDFWFSVQPVAKVEWPVFMFIARGCKKVSKQSLDSGEKIKLKYVDWTEFLDLVQQENFRDKETAFKLLKAMRNEKDLEKIRESIFR